jgi:hypothetical protein
MWDEAFLFVFGALFSISLWIVVGKRHRDVKRGKSTGESNGLRRLALFVAGIILGTYCIHYWFRSGLLYPGLGALLALLIGAVVGSFTARFVWSLFEARFGAKDPLIGVSVLLLLVVVYSIPVYHRELSALSGHIGLSSIKTPVLELGFAEHSQLRSSVIPASDPAGKEKSSAVPRPNNPRPALDALKHALSAESADSDYLAKDDRYILFFAGESVPDPPKGAYGKLSDPTLENVKTFFNPLKALAGCLGTYVDTFPDSQLLLVDTKPLIQLLFLFNADAYTSLIQKRIYKQDTVKYAADMQKIALRVRDNIFQALGLVPMYTYPEIAEDFFQKLQHLVGYTPALVFPRQEDLGKLLRERLDAPDTRIEEFLNTCNEDKFTAGSEEPVQELTYLQPYVSIALAKLLVAHGAPDEAVEVLTQWLDLWKCVRDGTHCRHELGEEDRRKLLSDATKLPEWFRIRAEFELNVLLYHLVGEANITYRDFLKEHADHFTNYAANPGKYITQTEHAVILPSVSIQAELHRCQRAERSMAISRAPQSPASSNLGKIILISLMQNEHTLIQSQRHFLSELDWTEIENLYERARTLTVLTKCLKGEGDQKNWAPTFAEYKITAGLFGLAAAEHLQNTADGRKWAEEIRKDAIENLREGYRDLKGYRDDDRHKYEKLPWSRRAFSVSDWEASCSLAEQAFSRLNESAL